jgi:F-type H+-transporting ATPase subunit gamma
MANLKDLRLRIASVKSTKKITSAMKMVSAAKLRRAQEAAESARPYAERMDRMMSNLGASVGTDGSVPRLMAGTGKSDVHLILVFSSDRGLCGGFNSFIARNTRQKIQQLQAEGKTVKLFMVGRKAKDQLRSAYEDLMVEQLQDIGKKGVSFADADSIAKTLIQMFEDGEFDVCWGVYNRFQSAMTQIVTWQQLVPFTADEAEETEEAGASTAYEYEPSQAGILESLVPRNLSVQIFRFLLESQASEHGARMTAMDNATRNAGDMIDKLEVTYNRSRQAAITSELIEIISGAEAV